MLIQRLFGRKRNTNIVITERNDAGYDLDPKTTGHVVVFGAHGSGKTDRFVIPNVKEIQQRGESVVVFSCGSRVYHETAAEFMKNGYEVRVLNPQSPGSSDKWDILAGLKPSIVKSLGQQSDDAQAMARAFIAASGVDVHCDADELEAVESLLKAILIWSCSDMCLGTKANMVREMLRAHWSSGKDFYDMLFSPANNVGYLTTAADAYSTYREIARDEVLSSRIVTKAISATRVLEARWAPMLFDENGNSSNHSFDLSLPLKRKCAYFIMGSPRDREVEVLSALFFHLLFHTMKQSLAEGMAVVPVTVIMDDAECVSRIDGLAETMTAVDPADIRVCSIWSSLDHLKRTYSADFEWNALLTCSRTKIGFGFADLETAQLFMDSPDFNVERSLMTARRGTCFVNVGDGQIFKVVEPA
jgi:type IV secretory pathway TraG/TraD family ATPase VirD4